jgi:hypothetical protein
MQTRIAHCHAAATAFGRQPAGARRADLVRLHRDHCWRASRGNDLDTHPDGLLLRLRACLGRMRTAIEDLEDAIARTPALTYFRGIRDPMDSGPLTGLPGADQPSFPSYAIYRMIFHAPSAWRWNTSNPGSSVVVLSPPGVVTVEIQVSRTTAREPDTRISLIRRPYRKDRAGSASA